MPVAEVTDLRKHYGAVQAVDGVSFTVEAGEILGIIGPNGAGKTTTVACLLGLCPRDGGQVRVLGMDPAVRGREVRQRVGVQLQHAALPDRLRVGEAVEVFAALAGARVDQVAVLGEWGLAGRERAAYGSLSGGQRQRLMAALALIGNPRLVVLDEHTAGLDPEGRRAGRETVTALAERGVAVVMTSHDLSEAERVCDRIAVLATGRIVALDAPAALIARLGPEARVVFRRPDDFRPDALRHLPAVARVAEDGADVVVHGAGDVLAQVTAALSSAGAVPTGLSYRQATLEDAYLQLVAAVHGEEISCARSAS